MSDTEIKLRTYLLASSDHNLHLDFVTTTRFPDDVRLLRLLVSDSARPTRNFETISTMRMMIIQESDAGILGKKKSECSYQESNLRPSDY